MLVGIIDHQTGTREIDRLSGLRRKMPATFAMMALGALSMAGVPLLNGFVSKEMILAALLEPPLAANLFTGAARAGGGGQRADRLLLPDLAHKIFFGRLGETTPVKPREASGACFFRRPS